MPRDFFDYLTYLGQQRFRAFIIHEGPDESHQLTAFVKKACHSHNGKYLDLLDLFIEREELSKNIDSFNPGKFRDLLINECDNHKLLIIDRGDFLLDTWRKKQKESYFRMIKNQWDSYRDGMKTILTFCLQSSDDIRQLELLDSNKENRIFTLADFYDIV